MLICETDSYRIDFDSPMFIVRTKTNVEEDICAEIAAISLKCLNNVDAKIGFVLIDDANENENKMNLKKAKILTSVLTDNSVKHKILFGVVQVRIIDGLVRSFWELLSPLLPNTLLTDSDSKRNAFIRSQTGNNF